MTVCETLCPHTCTFMGYVSKYTHLYTWLIPIAAYTCILVHTHMSVQRYVYICGCLHGPMHVRVCARACVPVSVRPCVCARARTCTRLRPYDWVGGSICLCVCVRLRPYVCACACACARVRTSAWVRARAPVGAHGARAWTFARGSPLGRAARIRCRFRRSVSSSVKGTASGVHGGSTDAG